MPHRACQIIVPPAASSRSPVERCRLSSHSKLSVLSLPNLRCPRPPVQSPRCDHRSLRAWNRPLQAGRTKWSVDPRLQTTNSLFPHWNRPFQDAWRLFAICVGILFALQDSSTSELAGFIELNDLKDGYFCTKPSTSKTLSLCFNKMN